MARLFCFGLGYTALRLAGQLLPQGWQVAGTTRSAETGTRLRAEGIEAMPFDRDRPLIEAGAALAGTTHLLISVPPDGVAAPSGDPVFDRHRADIAGLRDLVWLGYLSTTGVYGDHGGAWIDEEAAIAPTSGRGRRRAAAEAAWLSLWQSDRVPAHLFRLSGIYGPRRSAIDQVRAGRAKRIDKPGQVFNRIHVDDIVAVLRASMAQPRPGAVYNCADDEPAPSEAVIAHACRLLGAPAPPLVPLEAAGLSAMALSFYADNKRLRNDRIKRELGISLSYPTYREGLAAQIAAEQGQTAPAPATTTADRSQETG